MLIRVHMKTEKVYELKQKLFSHQVQVQVKYEKHMTQTEKCQ